MFGDRSDELRRVITLLDVVATVGTFLTAVGLRTALLEDSAEDFLSHVALLPFILALWIPSLAFFGGYDSPRITSRLGYSWAIGRAVTVGLAVLLTTLFFLKIQYVSRSVVVVFAALDFLVLVAIRLTVCAYFRRALRRGHLFHRVLVVGSGNRAQRLAALLLERDEWGIQIVGHLDPDPTRVGERVGEASVIGTVGDITSILKENVIDQVILAVPRAMIPDVDKIAQACEEEGVKLGLMADVLDMHVARTRLVGLGSLPVLMLEPVAHEEWKLFVKRLIDLTLASLAIPVIVPVCAVVALAIKLDSAGPVFFTQDRVGLHKRRFRMLKFRTMVPDAEQRQASVEHLNEAEGPIFKIANDPRITRVGRFLRHTSLDELPQLLHVMTGQMSLVGPRPMSLRDVGRFDRGLQRKRFSVKPGITCLWQVSGRSHLPFSRWLELDLEYIKNWSLSLDIAILFKTIPVVLTGKGAE